jgi:hypothetical protein
MDRTNAAAARAVESDGSLHQLWADSRRLLEAVSPLQSLWDAPIQSPLVAQSELVIGDTIWDCETCYVICWV